MDRRIRIGLGGIAALMAGGFLLCSTGCRSTRSEVPAGKPYQTTGGAPRRSASVRNHIPPQANGMSNLYGNRGPGAMAQDGMSPSAGQGATVYGTPTPGTSLRLAHGESIRTAGHLGNGRFGTRRDRPAHQLVAQRPAPGLSGPGQGPEQHVDRFPGATAAQAAAYP